MFHEKCFENCFLSFSHVSNYSRRRETDDEFSTFPDFDLHDLDGLRPHQFGKQFSSKVMIEKKSFFEKH